MQLLFYSCKFNEELFSLTLFLVSEFVCKGDKNCILYSIFELFDLQVLKSYGKSKRKGTGNKSKNAQEEEENRRSRGTAEPRSGENIQYPISFLHPLSMSYHFIITYPSFHWSVSIRQLRSSFLSISPRNKSTPIYSPSHPLEKNIFFPQSRQLCMKGKHYSFNTSVSPKNHFNLYLYLSIFLVSCIGPSLVCTIQ